MYKFKDYQNVITHLYKDDWKHIVIQHPERKHHLDNIRMAVQEPDFVIRDAERKNTVVYHKKFKQVTINNIPCSDFYLRVPIDSQKKIIKTAFFGPSKKRGEIIWQIGQKD